MGQVAFLTLAERDGFYIYDDMLQAPLAAKGWQLNNVVWHEKGINWDNFDVVVVRSTWDYQQYVDQFIAVLQSIEKSHAALENPYSVMQWNIDKRYLRDISATVPIVPTRWYDTFDTAKVANCFEFFAVNEIIIKPTVSANSDDTFRLNQAAFKRSREHLTQLFNNRSFMVQPFLNSILEEGEYSLFYFSGNYSHAILKRPAQGDFRVQEEHGGHLFAHSPTPDMLQCAQQALAAIPGECLYARIDLIRVEEHWAVMELELIEPSLYFNLDEASPQRFVDAFVAKYGHGE